MGDSGDILICDDEKIHSKVIRFYLQRAGIKNPVIYFDNGEALLHHLQTRYNAQEIDNPLPLMVLLDIKMPVMDGIGALKIIKKDKILKEIPVIMITTTDDPEDVDKCLEMGCDGYISKPIVYDFFAATLSRVLRQSLSTQK